MKFLAILLIKISAVSQINISVFVSSSNSKFSRFERELIETSMTLLNRKHKEKYNAKYIPIKKFGDLFKKVNLAKENEGIHSIAINTISVTKERKERFEFSVSYMPNKYCFLSADKISSNQNLKVGYIEESIIINYLEKLKKKYNYQFIPYKKTSRRLDDLRKNKIQLIVSDYIDIWSYDLKFFKEIKFFKKDQFSILMAKNCSLSDKLKNTFDYFLKSRAYYNLIDKYFGNDAVIILKRIISIYQ